MGSQVPGKEAAVSVMDMNEYALEIMVGLRLAEMWAQAERPQIPVGVPVGGPRRGMVRGALTRMGNVLLGLRGLSW